MPMYVVATSLQAGRPLQAVILGTTFLLMGAPVFLLAFFWKVGYDVDGIYCRSPWRRRRFIPWNDVERVRFSDLWKHWVVETRSSGSVTVPELAIGAKSAIEQWEENHIRNSVTRAGAR